MYIFQSKNIVPGQKMRLHEMKMYCLSSENAWSNWRQKNALACVFGKVDVFSLEKYMLRDNKKCSMYFLSNEFDQII